MKAKTISELLKHLPITPTSTLLSKIAYFLHERSHHRKEIHEAIASAFSLSLDDPQVDRLVKAHFNHLLQTILEIVRFDQLKEKWAELVTVEGMEQYWQIHQKGQGIILFSGHVGNWELLISCLPLLGIEKPYAVGWKQPESDFNNLLNQQRVLWGTKILWTQELDEKQVERILTGGGTLYIIGDHFEQGKTKVNLFGHPTGTPAGPVLFARRYNAALLPVHTFREGSIHRIIFEPPIDLKPLPPDGDFSEDLQRCMNKVENWIRKHPEQWIWIFKRGQWKIKS